MPVRDSINETIVLIYHGYCSRGYLLVEAYRGEASLSGTESDGGDLEFDKLVLWPWLT